VVAVLELTGEVNLTTFEYESLTDDVRGAALALPPEQFLIMTRESMLAMLPPGTDLAQCSEGQCEVEAGRRVGADLVVAGAVWWFAGDLSVSLKLFDTASAALLAQKTASGASLAEARDRLNQAALALFAPLMPQAPPEPEPVPPIKIVVPDTDPGRHRHDGFLLRMAVGPAYVRETGSSSDVSETVAGASMALSLAVGAALWDNFVLNLDLFGGVVYTPTVNSRSGGETSSGTVSGNLSTYGVGAGFTWYLTAANLLIGVSAGPAWTSFKGQDGSTSRSGVGFGSDILLGKEWWISDNWGMGAAVQSYLMSVPGATTDISGTSASTRFLVLGVGALLTFTYN